MKGQVFTLIVSRRELLHKLFEFSGCHGMFTDGIYSSVSHEWYHLEPANLSKMPIWASNMNKHWKGARGGVLWCDDPCTCSVYGVPATKWLSFFEHDWFNHDIIHNIHDCIFPNTLPIRSWEKLQMIKLTLYKCLFFCCDTRNVFFSVRMFIFLIVLTVASFFLQLLAAVSTKFI